MRDQYFNFFQLFQSFLLVLLDNYFFFKFDYTFYVDNFYLYLSTDFLNIEYMGLQTANQNQNNINNNNKTIFLSLKIFVVKIRGCHNYKFLKNIKGPNIYNILQLTKNNKYNYKTKLIKYQNIIHTSVTHKNFPTKEKFPVAFDLCYQYYNIQII